MGNVASNAGREAIVMVTIATIAITSRLVLSAPLMDTAPNVFLEMFHIKKITNAIHAQAIRMALMD